VIERLLYGESKFFGNVKPIIRPSPTAMSE
jgi:hypothetical protein